MLQTEGLPESYPSRWQLPASTELAAAVQAACDKLRAAQHFATAERLESALAKAERGGTSLTARTPAS